MIARHPEVADAATAWIQYDARNVLPVGGAWLDQAASFTDTVSEFDRARGYWDERKDEDRQRKAQQQQSK
jgi:hypothetical protein